MKQDTDDERAARYAAALRAGCAARGQPLHCPKCGQAHALLWDAAGIAWLLCLRCRVARTDQGDLPVKTRLVARAAGQYDQVAWIYELHVAPRALRGARPRH